MVLLNLLFIYSSSEYFSWMVFILIVYLIINLFLKCTHIAYFKISVVSLQLIFSEMFAYWFLDLFIRLSINNKIDTKIKICINKRLKKAKLILDKLAQYEKTPYWKQNGWRNFEIEISKNVKKIFHYHVEVIVIAIVHTWRHCLHFQWSTHFVSCFM